MEPEDSTLVGAVGIPVPSLRQVDDRELQTLTAMHCQNRDGLGIVFQPPGAFRNADLTGFRHPRPEPLDKCTDAELSGRHRRVEALAEVPQIGQHPFPSAQAQQPLRDVLVGHRSLQQGSDSAALEHLAPPADSLG
jgi:hypothetical protein